MKKKGFVILAGVVCLTLVLAAMPFMAACAKPAPAPAPTPAPAPAPAPPAPKPEPITLTVVSFLPRGWMPSFAARWLEEEIPKRSNGELIIDYRGGPEVIPTFEQPEAVRSGVVDMTITCGPYLSGVLPQGDFHCVTMHRPWEQRESGLFDYWVEAYAEKGWVYLGEVGGWVESTPYYISTNKKIEGLWDFAGLRFRSASLYEPFLKALGVSPVTMPGGDIYVAMERGEIDGFAWPVYAGFASLGFQEVSKYFIDEGFYGGGIVTLVNPDSWKSLPVHLQELLANAVADLEPIANDAFIEATQNEFEQMLAAGMEFIKLPPDEEKQFYKIAYAVKWADLRERLAPAEYDRFRSLLEWTKD